MIALEDGKEENSLPSDMTDVALPSRLHVWITYLGKMQTVAL